MTDPAASTATITQALKGLGYPCGRDRIVEYARAHNADPAALDVLSGIPDQTYRGMGDVFRGIGLAHGHSRPPFGKADKAGEPPRPVQPGRDGHLYPTEEPEPVTLEGQIEAGRPHPTGLPPQPARERPEHARRKRLLAGFRRMLGLG